MSAQHILHIGGLPTSTLEALERATTLADRAYLAITAAPQEASTASIQGMSEALALFKAVRLAMCELLKIHLDAP